MNRKSFGSKNAMKGLVILLAFVAVVICVTRIVAKGFQNGGEENIAKWVRRLGTIIPIAFFLVCSAFGLFYSVGETEDAVVETLGVPSLIQEAGPKFKVPFLQTVEKVDVTTKRMVIGYTEEDNQSVEAESLMITSDYNFVNVDFDVDYVISDPIAYIYSAKEPEVLLKNILLASIRSSVSNYTADEVLTTGKAKIETEILESVVKSLGDSNIGITVSDVKIQDAEPPTKEVENAFKAVEDAKQAMDTAINNANADAATRIPANEAEVDKILQSAKSQKTERVNEAKQEVAMFNAMYEEYVKDKETTKKRMFYEAMEEIMPSLKVIVDGSEVNLNALYPIENFSSTNMTGGTQ